MFIFLFISTIFYYFALFLFIGQLWWRIHDGKYWIPQWWIDWCCHESRDGDASKVRSSIHYPVCGKFWKVVAYYFVKNLNGADLAGYLKAVIKAITEMTSLRVVAWGSDNGPANIGCRTELMGTAKSKAKTYPWTFLNPVDNSTVHPYLLIILIKFQYSKLLELLSLLELSRCWKFVHIVILLNELVI